MTFFFFFCTNLSKIFMCVGPLRYVVKTGRGLLVKKQDRQKNPLRGLNRKLRLVVRKLRFSLSAVFS